MFAKLKKKVQEEMGAKGVGEGASFAGSGPGLARTDSSVLYPLTTDVIKEPESPSSIVSSLEDLTKENGIDEKASMLQTKKSEQMERLKAKVSDLAAVIHDKNKHIEKLENALEKQQDQMSCKIQDLNEQYQANRVKMSDNFSIALKKKDEEIKQISQDLEDRLRRAEDYRDKCFKREEENDEFTGLATQELAKIKHLLLNTQSDLNNRETELAVKSEQLQLVNKQLKDSNDEIQSLMEQISCLTSQSEEIEDVNKAIKKEKEGLEQKIEQLKAKFSQTRSEFKTLRQDYSSLQTEHQTVVRNSQMHSKKTTNMVETKDEEIAHLQERIMTLERRLQGASLSGDERVTALEKERKVLESQLAESREHLTQVKSSWNEKVTSFELQITNLNRKITEDAMKVRALEKLNEEGHIDKRDLQKRADRAEQECEKALKMNQQFLIEQKQQFESEITHMKQMHVEEEVKMKEKTSKLEKDFSVLEKMYEMEKTTSGKRIEKLLGEQDDWLQKEIDSERKISCLENEVESLKGEIGEKKLGNKNMISKLEEKQKDCEELLKKLHQGKSDLKTKDSKIETLHNSIKKLQLDYHSCVKEKDELLVRNAQLSQDFEAFKRQTRNDHGGIEKELQQRDSAIAGLEQSIQELQKEIKVTQDREGELTRQHEAALGVIESEEVSKMRDIIKDLGEQVLDKSRTIKMQQQRLADLKKTLQRELKVQALPNDDVSVTILASNSGYHTDTGITPRTTNSKSESRTNNVPPTLTPSASVPMSLNSMSVLRTLEAVTPKHMAGPSPYSANAQFQMNYVQPGNQHFQSLASSDDDPFQDCRDVNFQYLKHVVMKFLLSQESESMKLIRAVSVLLRFSVDEQKLIKETMEWKMSWFGTKPKLGKGQLAKVIPPPY